MANLMPEICIGAEAQEYRTYLDTIGMFELETAASLAGLHPAQLLQLTLAGKIEAEPDADEQKLWYRREDIERLLPNTVRAYLSPHELAEYCGKSVRQLARMRKHGGGPPFRRHLFRTILYPANGVYAWSHNTEDPGLAFYMEPRPNNVIELFPSKPEAEGDTFSTPH